MRRFKIFFGLGWAERALFLEAGLTLLLVKALIVIFPFKVVRGLVSKSILSPLSIQLFINDRVINDQAKVIRSVKVAIGRARCFVFWKRSFCLVNAIAAQRMLQKRGIFSTLHLGVAKTNGNLSAHAWVVYKDIEIIGNREKNQFVPIAFFNAVEPFQPHQNQ